MKLTYEIISKLWYVPTARYRNCRLHAPTVHISMEISVTLQTDILLQLLQIHSQGNQSIMPSLHTSNNFMILIGTEMIHVLISLLCQLQMI